MKFDIPNDGYWFKEENIKKIESLKDAKYVGYWCTKRPSGGWNESPVDVFYVENPNRSLGHSNYFGMFYQNDVLYITNAESAFSEDIYGVLTDKDEVLVSRYRHDYVEKDGAMTDGGRDYLKRSLSPVVKVSMIDGEFILERVDDE